MKNSILILIILLVIGVWSTVFTIDETEQVVILQFGQPVRIIKDPGLNFKLPAPIQVAQSFDTVSYTHLTIIMFVGKLLILYYFFKLCKLNLLLKRVLMI